ncbi:putative HicB family RNase H-like nuclease [Chryseobacterium defluvii]|uniref:Putative HicB family RNase H-like nuclease n=1 Tax=Chryseobacterium defluvii TaxID=160396 RepID=A0A840KHW6_9FLAO|nr:putative HicB family RNase H-like nuclease [Chryseobacterium defluvii]
MGEVQVSARVNPELKKRFEQKAKRYGVSMN